MGAGLHLDHHGHHAIFRGADRAAISPLDCCRQRCLAIIALHALVHGRHGDFRGPTVYGFGKTFSGRRCSAWYRSKRRAAGHDPQRHQRIGMLAVGVLGFPYIGALQADKDRSDRRHSAAKTAGCDSDGKLIPDVLDPRYIYEVIHYRVVTMTSSTADSDAYRRIEGEIASASAAAHNGPEDMALFPDHAGGLHHPDRYFVSKGGYRRRLIGHPSEPEKFAAVATPVR